MFFFSSRRRHTRCLSDWSSDVCSSDLVPEIAGRPAPRPVTDLVERGQIVLENVGAQVHLELRRAQPAAGGVLGFHGGREPLRSEERRVGKGGGSRMLAESDKRKQTAGR